MIILSQTAKRNIKLQSNQLISSGTLFNRQFCTDIIIVNKINVNDDIVAPSFCMVSFLRSSFFYLFFFMKDLAINCKDTQIATKLG